MEIIGVVIAFIVILIMIAKKANLGFSMFIGTLVMAIIIPDIGLLEYMNILKRGLFNETTVTLLIVMTNITIIAGIMSRAGLIDQMILALRVLFKRFETLLVIIPSILGILAVPGGAMMSAPLIDSLGNETNLDSSKKMAVNLLFRHTWYFIYPFVPGLIILANLMEVNAFYLIKYLFPLSIVMFVTGYIHLFKDLKIKNNLSEGKGSKYKAFIDLIKTISPIMVGVLLPLLFPIPFWFSLTLGLGILFIVTREKLSWQMIINSINWNMITGIAGIMLFKEAINSLPILDQIALLVSDKGIPLWLLVVILPAPVALLTGTMSGSIGVTFPLLAVMVNFKTNPEYLVLLYGSAFFCYYLSPVHLCLILTAEYFKVNLKEVYTTLLWPTLAVVLMNVLLFFLYS